MDESGRHINAVIVLKGVRLSTAKFTAPEGAMIKPIYLYAQHDQTNWTGSPLHRVHTSGDDLLGYL
jgi:hypothetical protein